MERKRNKNLEKLLEKPIDLFDVGYKQATENAIEWFEIYLTKSNDIEKWQESGKKEFFKYMMEK